MHKEITLTMLSFTMIVIALVSHVDAQSIMSIVPYTSCKGSGQLLEVRVSNCLSMPCTFIKGQRTTIQIDFIPKAGTTHVTTGANAHIGPLVLPFRDINGSDACGRIYLKETGQNVGCDLVPGQVYTYSYDVEILHRFPTANAEVRWELADVTRQKIVCFQLAVTIAA